jgi:hypothetical protein
MLAVACLLALGTKNAKAEWLVSSYSLGDNYSLHLGKKSAGLHYFDNIVGLKKSDMISNGDALMFTLAKPDQQFGSPSTSAGLGVVYTNSLSRDVTSNFSLFSGSAGDIGGTQSVAVAFHINIKLQ